MIVTLPCVLLLFDFWPLERVKGNSFKEKALCLGGLAWEKAPLFVLAAAFSILTVITQGTQAMVDLESVPVSVRLGNMGPAYLAYLKNIFWPTGLAIFYPASPQGPGVIKALLAWGALGLISALVIFFRKRSYLFVGWFLFAGVLFPVSGIMQSGLQGMADRFAYIPVIGIFIMVVFGLQDLGSRFSQARIPAMAAGTAAFLLCPLLTAKQVSYWKSSVTIMERTVAVTENNWFAEQVLGSALYKENRLDEALIHLKNSLVGHPDFAPTYNALGMVYHSKGQYMQAVDCYLRAIGEGSTQYHYYNNLGLSLFQAGENQRALEAFKQALKNEPNSHQLHFNIGMLYQHMGDNHLAKQHYIKTRELNPDFLPVYNNLGILAIAEGEFDHACSILWTHYVMAGSKESPTLFNLGAKS